MNAKRFKEEFVKSKLGLNELSRKSGVNASTISRILSGDLLDIKGDTILKLEKELKLKKGDLL